MCSRQVFLKEVLEIFIGQHSIDEDGLGVFPEYQYHITDHLGNVRLTFTSDPKTDIDVATMETANQEDEYAEFLYYENATRINSELFDHPESGDTHYAIRLNGTDKERTGLVKTLSVMPGDVIYTEVHAKYLDTDEQGDWTQVLQAFIASIANGSAPTGTLLEGVKVTPGMEFPYPDVINKSGDLSKVKAYLNYLVFDKDGNPILGKSGYKAVTALGAEDGEGDVNGGDHQKLSTTITITEPGLVYIYLSNDNPDPFDVFFDDFKVEHIQSPIVQADDYYPFGLSFNSYQRENNIGNKYLYNDGSELQEDLGLGVFQTHFRMLDPAIGRWWQIDPNADFENLVSWTPYNSMFNNPVRYNDPLGDCPPGQDCPEPVNELAESVLKLADAIDEGIESVKQTVSDGVDYLFGSHEGEGEKRDGGGIHITSKTDVSPTKTEAENDPEMNGDVLLKAMGKAGAGKLKGGSLDIPKALSRGKGVVEVLNNSSSESNEGSSTTNTTTQTNATNSNGADTIREMHLRGESYQIKQYVTNEKGDTTHETRIGSNIFFPRK